MATSVNEKKTEQIVSRHLDSDPYKKQVNVEMQKSDIPKINKLLKMDTNLVFFSVSCVGSAIHWKSVFMGFKAGTVLRADCSSKDMSYINVLEDLTGGESNSLST